MDSGIKVFDIHSYIGGSVVPGVCNNANAVRSLMLERHVTAGMAISAHARTVDLVSGNRILRAMVNQGPGLYGCITTNPNRTEASITIMRELMASRRMVAMVIVPPRPGDPITRMVADEILNAYRRYSKPLMLYTPNEASVLAALDIAKSFPMLRVVFLGMGGDDWRAAIAAAHSATNVYLETSGPPDRAKLPAAFSVLGVHRVLFGSGCPHVDPAAALGLVHDAPLSDEAKRRVLYDNATRLLGLDEVDTPA